MTRKEVYEIIKNNNLQDEVKNNFGRNFTQVPTSKLEEFIKLAEKADNKVSYKPIEEGECSRKDTCDTNIEYVQEVDNAYEAACLTFLHVLKDSGKWAELLAKL